MFVQLNSVIIDSDPANRQELANFLSTFGVNIVGQFSTVENIPQLLTRADAPQLVIINLDPGASDNLRKIGQFPRQFPNVSFFVMSQVLDPNLLMEAMHLGVKEFIPLPIGEQKFAAAVERAAQIHGMGKKARIIHVVPTQGGCGSTSVACNIAASLAANHKAALIDLDLLRGGVASYFDTRARFTIADVMESGEKVDKQLLDNALAIHQKSKLAILSRPDLPEDALRVNQPGINRLFNILGRMFDYVVADSMMSIDPVYSTAIQAADVNLIVDRKSVV